MAALKKTVSFFILIICLGNTLLAQDISFQTDTLRTDLNGAESMFLQHNLSLLAQRYNIEATKALEIQARLYPNPNISVARGFYQTQVDKIFATGKEGNTDASLSQLILLAGKRNKQIKIAEANTSLAQYQFYDLLRTLKYTLHTDFFNIYYLQQSAKIYNEEINSLQQVVKAFDEQEGKGYISEKEVIRIKAQLYSLLSEYNDLVNQINDKESELRLVLQVKDAYIYPLVDTNKVAAQDVAKFSLNSLVDSAYQNRSDLLVAKANTEISKLNYSYQKALAIPDLSLSLSYSQQGSYINNYNALGAAIDIPLFNRNQGNIKNAERMIKYNDALQLNTQVTVEEQVGRAVQMALDADKLYRGIDPSFANNFSRLQQQVLINYEKRNIGLLEFIDFYDSYKQTILQINTIQFNKINALEEINFYTGTNFFN